MARHQHVPAGISKLAKEIDDIRARHRIKPVQGLVEDQHPRAVGDGLRETSALAHPLAEGFDALQGDIGKSDAAQRFERQHSSVATGETVDFQEIRDEIERRHTLGKGVVLRAIADVAEKPFMVADRDAQDVDLAPARVQQTRDQVHQGRLTRAVRPNEARDTWRKVEFHPIHPEHIAVELRHVAQTNTGTTHETTSNAVIRRRSATRLTTPTITSTTKP